MEAGEVPDDIRGLEPTLSRTVESGRRHKSTVAVPSRNYVPRSDRDSNDFALDQDGVCCTAARTGPRLYLHPTVKRPSMYQYIRLSLTTDALGSDRLCLSDVHGGVHPVVVRFQIRYRCSLPIGWLSRHEPGF
jgi:hypothetical protein